MCTYYIGLSFLKSFEHLNEFPVTYYWPVLRSVRWMGIYITPIHDFVSNSNRTCTLKKKKNRRVHRALQRHFRFFLKKVVLSETQEPRNACAAGSRGESTLIFV